MKATLIATLGAVALANNETNHTGLPLSNVSAPLVNSTFNLTNDLNETKTGNATFGQTETGWPTVNGVPLGHGPVIINGSLLHGDAPLVNSTFNLTNDLNETNHTFGRSPSGFPTRRGGAWGHGPVKLPTHDEFEKKFEEMRKRAGFGPMPAFPGFPGFHDAPLVNSTFNLTNDLNSTDIAEFEKRFEEIRKRAGFGRTPEGFPTHPGFGHGPVVNGPRFPARRNNTGFGANENGWPTWNGIPLGHGPVIVNGSLRHGDAPLVNSTFNLTNDLNKTTNSTH